MLDLASYNANCKLVSSIYQKRNKQSRALESDLLAVATQASSTSSRLSL